MEKEFNFLPKPFTFDKLIVKSGRTKVYIPETTCREYEHGIRTCLCVHVCKQFQDYPTIEWGIKCVPADAKCEFCHDGKCDCSRLVKNGQITRVLSPYIKFSFKMMRGLTKSER